MYEGQYFRDKKQGFGVFKWASGNIYRGQYKEDEEGLFENNVYKGPEGASSPAELCDPNFDIMSIAPKDVMFSGEIRTFPTAACNPRTPQPTVPAHCSPQRRIMTATNNVVRKGRNALRLLPASRVPGREPIVNATQFVQRRMAAETPKYGYMRDTQSSLIARSAVVPASRSLLQQIHARGTYERKKMNETAVYETAPMVPERQPRRQRQASANRRTWMPAGKMHHAESRGRPRASLFH